MGRGNFVLAVKRALPSISTASGASEAELLSLSEPDLTELLHEQSVGVLARNRIVEEARRKAKEAALISMQDYEQAAEAQHKEWAADVARLQDDLGRVLRLQEETHQQV